ncbi:endonuclease 4-like isoform X8 [Cicer arietinum]|uniref:Aspergillus nuclease S1 n=1 Tax=Cicer arietinum TaxID=3827 RepID=A0A3Q7XDW2_CICAR|nr:endonuclease 4-like isoform X7 [Cicer arietinum]
MDGPKLRCNERAITVLVVLLMPLALPTVLGWGKDGHYAICKISLETVTILPDINIDVLLEQYTIIQCNSNQLVVLQFASFPLSITDNLTEALMFLSHFVGDVHQPLHVGFTGDLGGNSITVRWYRRKTNLHHVWDDMIIESALKTFYGSDLSIMIQAIQSNITDIWSNDISFWEHCAHNYTACPDRYASESISLACKFAYKNATPGSTLEDEYFLSRLPIVEKRLAQGGVRLAAILNRIFTSNKASIAQA